MLIEELQNSVGRVNDVLDVLCLKDAEACELIKCENTFLSKIRTLALGEGDIYTTRYIKSAITRLDKLHNILIKSNRKYAIDIYKTFPQRIKAMQWGARGTVYHNISLQANITPRMIKSYLYNELVYPNSVLINVIDAKLKELNI